MIPFHLKGWDLKGYQKALHLKGLKLKGYHLKGFPRRVCYTIVSPHLSKQTPTQTNPIPTRVRLTGIRL